jgi:beta-fructofuranosidase
VLKLSVMANPQDYYVVGRYDDSVYTFEAAGADNDSRTWRRLDYGHVYASKSFFDARKNRRVLWGWANESDTEADYVARGWSGVQTVPRKIWLDSSGKQLLQWPIKEIETLRKKKVRLQGTKVNSGGVNEIIGVTGSQADVEVVFKIPILEGAENIEPNELLDPPKLCGKKGASIRGGIGPFGLLVLASGDLQEHTSVFFSVFKHDGKFKVLMCTDLRRYNKNRASSVLNLSKCSDSKIMILTIFLKINLCRSTTRADVYKPPYGGFVDIDIEKERSISLRTLVSSSSQTVHYPDTYLHWKIE